MNNKIREKILQACAKGDLATLKSLKHKADLNIQNCHPLIIAAYNGRLNIVTYLIEHGLDIHTQDNNAFIEACAQGHIDVVKYLLEKGADIHAQQDWGFIYAASYGHLEITKYLISQGIDPHLQNNIAFTKASSNDYLEIVQYFVLEHNFDPLLAKIHAQKMQADTVFDWCERYIKTKKLKDKMESNLPSKKSSVKVKI